MPIPKIDPKKIFASQAPSQDVPAEFNNYERGWDESRKNNGKPTIKQFNKLQQLTDEKILWMHQNGAALPFDETMEYVEGAVVVKDGDLQQLRGGEWVSATNKGYSLDYFVDGKSYPLNARIMLENGDIVKSTVANNTVDPNVDMTGWVSDLYFTVNLVSDISGFRLAKAGDFIFAKGFYSAGDGGGGLFLVKNDTTSVADNVTTFRLNPSTLAVMYSDSVVDIRRFGVVVSPLATPPSELVDQTTKFSLAITSDFSVSIPAGRFKVTNSIPVTKRKKLHGENLWDSQIIFVPTLAETPLFDFYLGGNRSDFSDFSVIGLDTNNFNGAITRFTGTLGDADFPYKNKFSRIGGYGLSLVAKFTTTNPLNGANHAMCAENSFEDCRFGTIKKYVLNENTQAVNNFFINCDFENDERMPNDADNIYIEDKAGGGFHFIGGSIIGKGILYQWGYPVGGSTLWTGSTIDFKDVRLECRTIHKGVILNQNTASDTSKPTQLNLSMRDVVMVNYGVALDLLRYCGQINATFDNVTTPSYDNQLIIRQYPTLAASAVLDIGSRGVVNVYSSSVLAIRETSSPYGTYNSACVSPINFIAGKGNSAAPRTKDALGFLQTGIAANAKVFGTYYNDTPAFGKMILASESTNANLYGTQKLILPVGLRLLKFGFFCPSSSKASAVTVDLYIVKDAADWGVANTLNLTTDAFLVSTITCPANETGLYEVPINTALATNLPSNNKTGGTGWTEGRIALKFSAEVSGFVYVEYC